MKKRYKISLLVFGVLLALSLMLSSSYALWVFNVSQESTNVVVSDCMEVTFTEGSNAIHLTNTFPMKDNMMNKIEPYVYTIKNICNHNVESFAFLEELESTFDVSNLRIKANVGYPYDYQSESGVPLSNDANSATVIGRELLKPGEEKTLSLRIWVKSDANSEEVVNGSFSGRVTVVSRLLKDLNEGTFITGKEFNRAIGKLTYDDQNEASEHYDIDYFNRESIDNDYGTYGINSIEYDLNNDTDNLLETYPHAIVSTEDSDYPIYAFYDKENGLMIISSKNDVIYLNPDSSFMFFNLMGCNFINFDFYDTSKVEDMSYMFAVSTGWNVYSNLYLNSFDTSNVTNMSYMFYQALDEALDLSGFETRNVEDMSYMFAGNGNLIELNIDSFDTRNVTNMSHMFEDLLVQNLDLSHFDTSKVTNMSYMFYALSDIHNLDLSSFDTSNVEDMSYMFDAIGQLEWGLMPELDISHFDMSSVTNIEGMFEGTIVNSLVLGDFYVPNVTSTKELFKWARINNLSLDSFDTSNVTDMEAMFQEYQGPFDLTLLNTSNVTNMSYMFCAASIKNIKNPEFTVAVIIDTSLRFDLSSFDTSKVTNMSSMFGDRNMGSDVYRIYVSDKWNTDNVTNSSYMFNRCSNLTGGKGTSYNSSHIDKEYARIDDPDNGKPGYLTYIGQAAADDAELQDPPGSVM